MQGLDPAVVVYQRDSVIAVDHLDDPVTVTVRSGAKRDFRPLQEESDLVEVSGREHADAHQRRVELEIRAERGTL